MLNEAYVLEVGACHSSCSHNTVGLCYDRHARGDAYVRARERDEKEKIARKALLVEPLNQLR